MERSDMFFPVPCSDTDNGRRMMMEAVLGMGLANWEMVVPTKSHAYNTASCQFPSSCVSF